MKIKYLPIVLAIALSIGAVSTGSYKNLHSPGQVSFSKVGTTDIDRVGFVITINENPQFWIIMVDQHEYLANDRGGMLHLESCSNRSH